ncbi:hypothetical protein CCHR01_14331 [Colletotrichum chrysophilum]|uniref:Uncharacterized protein n=1 Tax=Colletotrichum chrysophilum TaxID=1836956 RepID=A0AAD9A7S6_9PEZI|nr:hypothetical protein CCHR01_14331 [Colletotrichum chrysophilum]
MAIKAITILPAQTAWYRPFLFLGHTRGLTMIHLHRLRSSRGQQLYAKPWRK